MRKTRLQDMTAAEFAARVAEKPLILLPFGAQEQQGPHAPMGDFVLARALAERVAAGSDNVVVAPTVPFGESESVRGMPGAISLPPATVARLVEDICENFFEHGLDHVVLFNGQTSNGAAFDMATRAIKARHGIHVPTLNIWRLLTPSQLKEFYGDALAGSQGHGGDPITSMFLHLFPDIVRMDLLEPPHVWPQAMGLKTRSPLSVDFRGIAVPLPFDITQMSPNGNLSGDGRAASAEIGAKTADAIVAISVAFLAHFRAHDPRTLKPLAS